MFIVDAVREPIEVLRRRWDPDMAARIAAHVTLIYDREAADLALLTERLTEASRSVGPFKLHLGGTACFGAPSGGIYVTVDDVEGGVARLRERILQPLFVQRWKPLTPHVTLLHPRHGSRGEEAWRALQDVRFDRDILVDRVTLIENRGSGWAPLAEFPLSGEPGG